MLDIKSFIKSNIPESLLKTIYKIFFSSECKKSFEVYSMLNNYYDDNNSISNNLVNDFIKKELDNIIKISLTVKYYKKNVIREGFEIKLSDFPLLDKQIIRKNFDDLKNENEKKFKWFNFNTGGSTGEPLQFRISKLCGLIDAEHQKFCFEKIGFKTDDKIFAFDGASIPRKDLDKNIFWVKKSKRELPFGSIHFSSHYFNEKNAVYYIEKILKERPSILRGYPSFISDIAKYVSKLNHLNFDFIKGILLTSEAIFENQIQIIEETFNTKVILQYGHSEMCVYAMKLPNDIAYICSPFYGYTEILDEKGNHVKKGEKGEIVVTSFYNRAMPFIRYKTGDLAEYGGKINGAVILNKLEGRDQDFLINKHDDKISITGIIFGRHYKAFKSIKKWQINQKNKGSATFLIIPKESFSNKDEIELIESFKNLVSIDIQIKLVKEIPLTGRGKFRFVTHE